jgi:hypothetical protein
LGAKTIAGFWVGNGVDAFFFGISRCLNLRFAETSFSWNVEKRLFFELLPNMGAGEPCFYGFSAIGKTQQLAEEAIKCVKTGFFEGKNDAQKIYLAKSP